METHLCAGQPIGIAAFILRALSGDQAQRIINPQWGNSTL
jgi:hypothetical protein